MQSAFHVVPVGAAPWLAALCSLTGPTPAAPPAAFPGDAPDAALEAALTRAVTEQGHEPVWQVGTPFEGVPAAWQAPNRARGIRTYFLEDGVRLVPFAQQEALDFTLAVRLAGVQRGDETRSLGPVEAEHRGGRIEYARDGVVEWYDNGERGLEQGFDLSARPFPAAPGPLELLVALDGDLAPAEIADERFVLTDAGGARVLSVSGLVARDAAGRRLASRFERRREGVAIVVDDAGARYPIVVDPTFEGEEAKLVPTRLPGAGGRALSVSGDRAVVGGGTGVYVLVRSGAGEWLVQTKLTSTDPTDEFGFDVAIFGDWVVVGAPDDGGFAGEGAAYTYEFELDVGRWEPRTKLFAPNVSGTFSEFGRAVDITEEFLAVADPFYSGAANQTGVVGIYKRSGDAWLAHQAFGLPASANPFSHFGQSVDITPTRLAAGAPGHAGTGLVRVYEYDFDEGEYQLDALLESTATLDLGASVSLSGSYLLSGSPSTNSARGVALLFQRTGGAWVEKLELPGSTDGERFGGRVAMTGLASGAVRALIAARWSDGAFNWTGRVAVYEGTGLGMTQVATLLPPTGSATSGALFGTSLAAGADFALVGAVGRSEVHAFESVGLSWSHVQVFEGRAHDPGDTFGSAVALAGDYALVGARLDGDVAAESGSAHLFQRIAGEWQNVGTLRGNPVQLAANYGTAVALADGAQRALVGAPLQDGAGAAFVHIKTLGSGWAEGVRLSPPSAADGDQYGSAVDVSMDLALVGAPRADDLAVDGGVAHLFRRSALGLWLYEQAFEDPQGMDFDDLGRAVQLFGDDEVLLGVPGSDAVAPNAGKVLRFRDSGTSWVLDGPLAPPTLAPESGFGFSLASDGDLLAVGAPLGATGAVHLYRRVGPDWVHEAQLDGEPGFGRSVGLDGTRLAVGGIDRAWAYTEVGDVWLPVELVPSDGPIQGFLETTPVAAGGGAILVGADGDDGAGLLAGAAYVFRPEPPEIFVPFGFGDGSLLPCPCGNESAPGSGSGCANSTGLGGLLSASGSSSLAADDMLLEAENMRPNSPCVLFEGDVATAGTTFGDGLRFVSGQTHRVDGTHFADGSGRSSWTGLHGFGLWEECDTRYFQVFYRDAAAGGSPCGTIFNLTNGMQVTFLP